MREEMTAVDFRRICARFATGVAVLTALDEEGNPHGLTVNSFASVSAEPPLVLVCVDLRSALLPLFDRVEFYGLSFLDASQQDLSDRFAFVPERRFDNVPWSVDHQVPVITDALAWFACRVHSRITVGDHRVLFAQTIAGGTSNQDSAGPLLYYASGYRRLPEQ